MSRRGLGACRRTPQQKRSGNQHKRDKGQDPEQVVEREHRRLRLDYVIKQRHRLFAPAPK
jgi:hypothetical protein